MKRFLKLGTLILMVLLMSGSVWANTYTDHITTAPNNKGDVLIFPWYLAADGGWQTKLTVINTDKVNSVVAKLIIRSYKDSQELLDFFLYLSPADVWTGVIRYESGVGTAIYSDDDSAQSAIIPSVVWADTTPIDQPMFPIKCTDGDADFLGYVEIITAAAGPVSPASPGVSKSSIYSAYQTLLTGGNSALKWAITYPQGSRINALAGYMQFQNPTAGFDTSLKATALKDYANSEQMTTGSETRLGASANNNLAEIEAALSKDDLAMPYVSGDNGVALHFFTFPTKLTQDCGNSAPLGPYFGNSGWNVDLDDCVKYTAVTYDLTEKYPQSGSPFSGGGSQTYTLCNEVNFLSSAAFAFPEGWANYVFNGAGTGYVNAKNKATATLVYYGTPVLPTYVYLSAAGMSANYGAWTDSLVACGTATADTLIDYQYTDSAPGLCTNPG